MDVIPAHTRRFSEIVRQAYAFAYAEQPDKDSLKLLADFFGGDRGAIVKVPYDQAGFETVARVRVGESDLAETVASWKTNLPLFDRHRRPEMENGYLLSRIPTEPADNFSDFVQRLTPGNKETSLVGIIEQGQDSCCLLWLYRNVEKQNFVAHDLELLKMILRHLQQAIQFRRRVDSLKDHVRANGN